jgi:hypothetical protein
MAVAAGLQGQYYYGVSAGLLTVCIIIYDFAKYTTN